MFSQKLFLSRLHGCLAIVCFSVAMSLSSQAAVTVLVKFGFNNTGGGDNINEATGWDGTTVAAGGSLDANVSLVSSLQIAGGYVAGGGTDVFHVDYWHSSDLATAVSLGKNVNFTIAPQAGYMLDLEGGSLITRLHSHAQGGDPTKVFDRVSLYIGNTQVGTQNYLHSDPAEPVVQDLVWNIGTGLGLNGLTGSQNVKFYFWDSTGGTYEPGVNDHQHGPQWDNVDGAYIQLNGSTSPVPEPTRAILGLCGLAVCFLRRRR
jgi:hypothetical protein